MRTYCVRTFIDEGQIWMVSRKAPEYATSVLSEACQVYNKEVDWLAANFYLRHELDHEPTPAEERLARYCMLTAVDSKDPDNELVIDASDKYYE